MEKFCESVREHIMKLIDFKKKTMKLLIKEQLESEENAEICYICKETFENKYLNDKKFYKVRDHWHYTGEYRGAVHSISNLKNSVSFHIGYSYDYHFILKELAE